MIRTVRMTSVSNRIAMAILPVSVSKTTRMLNSSQKIGVNSQAARLIGFAPGWTAAGGSVADGCGVGLAPPSVGLAAGEVTGEPADGDAGTDGEAGVRAGTQAPMTRAVRSARPRRISGRRTSRRSRRGRGVI